MLNWGVEFRQLHSFLVVAEEEHISAAAGRLNLQPPELSSRIKSLEKELGWELLDWGAEPMSLTRAGRIVAWEGRKLMRQVELARERMRREIDGDVLRVGYAPALAHRFLGVAMERFVERHPGFRVELADADREEMLHALQDGSMDLVVEVAGPDPGVDWVPLVQRDWHVAVPDQHALSGKTFVSPADLDGERLLLFSKAENPGYWEKLMNYFREHRIEANVAGEFDGRSGMLTALEAGMGVALVVSGELMEKHTAGRVLVKRLEPAPETLRVGVGTVADRNLDPWVLEFVEELKSAASENRG
jgi:DNA-binding transcriptional LysR family regulator